NRARPNDRQAPDADRPCELALTRYPRGDDRCGIGFSRDMLSRIKRRERAMATAAEQAAPWLKGRSFNSWREEFDRQGYLIFERVLSAENVAAIRAALAPHLARDLKGRNNFEGEKTNRVYALMAKSPLFAELAIHPLALAFAEAELGESCLLS